MSSTQAAMRELRILRQEETTLINLASKISDQLNRLKVEELALQNHVRLQNEELDRKSRGSQRSLPMEEFDEDTNMENEEEDSVEGDNFTGLKERVVPLNLVVNAHNHIVDDEIEEEEDEEMEEIQDNQLGREMPARSGNHDDIESFVNSL